MENTQIIHFTEVDFSYDQLQVLHQVSFEVTRGEFVCLTGKSGCGKSTLLKLISGLLQRQTGSVAILQQNMDEWEIHQLRRKVGFVFQEGALFPHQTAYQNMCYCMKLNGYDADACQRRILELLPLVNLDDSVLEKFPDELSGGQRQRVGIIRALAHNPEMVLMDEPFSALDAETRESLQELVKSIHKQLNTTFVMVTHNRDEAQKLATRTLHMSEGKIQTIQ